MIIALWILNALLALIFVVLGARKVILPKETLHKSMHWVTNVPPAVIKLLGLAEVVGGLGLVVPLATGTATLLAPIAAVCLFAVMVGAVIVHAKLGERVIFPTVVGVLLIASAVLGFAIL